MLTLIAPPPLQQPFALAFAALAGRAGGAPALMNTRGAGPATGRPARAQLPYPYHCGAGATK